MTTPYSPPHWPVPADLIVSGDAHLLNLMADLVKQHLEKHPGVVDGIDEDPPLRLDELPPWAGTRQARLAERGRRARVFRQIHDLAQALEMEIRHAIESAHDRVDRDDVLPRKSLEQEIEPPVLTDSLAGIRFLKNRRMREYLSSSRIDRDGRRDTQFARSAKEASEERQGHHARRVRSAPNPCRATYPEIFCLV